MYSYIGIFKMIRINLILAQNIRDIYSNIILFTSVNEFSIL